ncbi:hypothetical protein B0T25DRAFT_548658 [Lasiosphaeria hispida]|uniref:MIT domain-containing protein n=1 Tax=Lasiosphaeria hispida TaxID=260671 RepID=A0AAJ0HF14_9PEZI|nr:hypothetical protein B0T25DRAFT_548658 [Lasiosphaeria hispida]
MPPTAVTSTPSTSNSEPDAKFSVAAPPFATLIISATSPTQPKPGPFASPSFLSSPWARTKNREFASPGSGSIHRREAVSRGTPAAQTAEAASPTQHKPSAATVHRASYTTFPPPTTLPPRPPSLLPAARITFDPAAKDAPPKLNSYLDDPFNESAPHATAPDPAKDLEPPRWRGHSRSSSAGGLSDSFRNLNRWSASSTSSRTSNLTSFTRRVSAEVLAGAFGSPSRKLHKSRPSTASASPRTDLLPLVPSESPIPPPIPPLQILPDISTGPSLEEEVRGSNLLGRLSLVQRPIHARRPSDDPGLYWDGTPEFLGENSGLSLQQPLGRAVPPPLPATQAPATTMPYTQSREPRGHSRSRSAGTSGVVDLNSRNRDRDRDRPGRPPSQRAMLSRALQKANTAVQLDNAQNVEGARRAYSEACSLLQQVLQRTSGEEDRNKLDAIHKTYTARIIELDELSIGMEPDDKELPERPESNEIHDVLASQVGAHEEEEDNVRGHMEFSPASPERDIEPERTVPSYSVPRQPSRAAPDLSIEVTRDTRDVPSSTYLTEHYSLQSAFSRSRLENNHALQPPMDNLFVPALSPRRPISPANPPPPPPVQDRGSPERAIRTDFTMSGARLAPGISARGHQRGNSHESVSWLDPIDESAGSSASSVHSRSSSMNIRRRHIRAASGDTEAEFDAALDDAIEAAYDDGYEPEPSLYGVERLQEDSEMAVANTLRRVELARERVRESEREALELANERERKLRLQQQLEDEEYRQQEGLEDFYDGNDTDDEERILEEMTRGYAIEDFAFGILSRQPIPRESDSSGWTNRTWHSSMGSNPPTSTTILTTVSEHVALPQPKGPLPPPPTQALPQLPPQPTSAGSQSSTQSVRNRRLSGQNPKQLKIETNKTAQAAPATAGPAIPAQPKTGGYIVQQRQALSAGPARTTGPLSSKPVPSPAPVTGASRDESATPPLPPMAPPQDEQPRSGSPPVARPSLRKNFSASSLKSIKSRNLSVSNIDDASDLSPGTPLSNQYGIGGSSTRLPALPSIPTPLAVAFKERANSSGTGGMHLFDNQFHSPHSPGSPNPMMADAPAPLEPCPNDTMLRPFWLMRALYQTLCHPRGGYVSNKLFVPRDVWQVKGVKLKNLEDKISNCDYLTAALQKLSRVDTCDADAVLEEMQSLEGVLEQVQATLTRKLGNEVGVHGASAMFKDANSVESEAASLPRSASVAGKGSSFSWRRLRSKGSSANLPGLATSYGGKGGSGGASASTMPVDGAASKEALLASLPMTVHPTSRPTKRDIGSVLFAGLNANYMSSLARLFDAAQAIGEFWSGIAVGARGRTDDAMPDQIARQVEDPGLRHADKTQVGLELCTRHAAEFFAFYICRFVLSDLTMMLDKFLKRGSEWVLA